MSYYSDSNASKALQDATKYLLDIGVEQKQVDLLLNPNDFTDVFVMKLATVNVLKENRPLGSSSNQTHIHITGIGREIFYSSHELSVVKESTEDTVINVNLIENNLEDINNEIPISNNLRLVNSTTVKKISKRKNQESQVQISKFRYDGLDFLRLRKGLYTGDYLMFLRYKNTIDTYLAIGIPSRYSNLTTAKYDFSPQTSNISHTSVNEQSSAKYHLNFVNTANIIDYSITSDDTDDHTFDLTNALQSRAERTLRHQQMLKFLANLLEKEGCSLYAGNIDCLATKEDTISIFEIKTLSGTISDEIKQVRAAFAQLHYYERFAAQQFSGKVNNKFAFFSSKVSDEHIEFLQDHDILVLWLNNDTLNGTAEALSKFQLV